MEYELHNFIYNWFNTFRIGKNAWKIVVELRCSHLMPTRKFRQKNQPNIKFSLRRYKQGLASGRYVFEQHPLRIIWLRIVINYIN